MNWTDYFIAGVLAVSVLIGLWRGLVAEVLSLAIWIGSIWVAWAFGEEPGQQIHADLLRMKQLLETGEVPTIKGQPRGTQSILNYD